MFPIGSVLGKLPPIRIIDVGAMAIGPDAYQRLAASVACEVIGFEPNEAECERLNAIAAPGRRYLPYVIGDGSAQTFYECAAPECSSLLEPNGALVAKFALFVDMLKVVSTTPVQTRRLDDLSEAQGGDFLKLDVQGGELMVLQGATELLRETVVIHTELEFAPLYKGQPLFADIDTWLRARGFVLHNIPGFGARPFEPMVQLMPDAEPVLSQLLWCDAIYVRDFMRLEALSDAQLMKLAAILHENYGSYDFVSFVLKELDRRSPSGLQARYLRNFA
jgi:FkbM family methyltransferase